MNKNQQRELAGLIGKYSKTDGLNDTAIAPLHFFKMSAPSARMPVVYSASLCLVVQGEKEVMLEDESYRYAASEFLVVSVDLPATGHVTVATPEQPYLCLQVDLDPRQLSDLITETVRTEVDGAPTERALFIGSTDDQLTDALLRLARLLDTPRDIALLGADGHTRDLLSAAEWSLWPAHRADSDSRHQHAAYCARDWNAEEQIYRTNPRGRPGRNGPYEPVVFALSFQRSDGHEPAAISETPASAGSATLVIGRHGCGKRSVSCRL